MVSENNKSGGLPQNGTTSEELLRELEECKQKIRQLEKNAVIIETLPLIFHKLKNKLTPILGYSQMLLTKIQDPAILARIKKIDNNASELTGQLNALKDYFITGDNLREEIGLNQILQNLEPWFDTVRESGQVVIELDFDEKIPQDLFSTGQIETLIKELVKNSLTAIKSKDSWQGVVEIETENETDCYHLTVKDNGIGIDEENLALIWEPFYSQFPEQAGIGLTICEKIIANHGASHDVTTKAGEYAEVKITFSKKKLKTRDIEKLS